MKRPTISHDAAGAAAQATAAIASSAADSSMICLRPTRSHSRPAASTPNTHPSSPELTNQPSMIAEQPNSAFTGASVPAITTVSYPNRNPTIPDPTPTNLPNTTFPPPAPHPPPPHPHP